jgi:predicted RNA methylase
MNELIEERRFATQEELDSRKTIDERRRLGQFATPTKLAHDIVTFALKHIDAPTDIRFFEPAFGTGAFFSALLQVTDTSNITQVTAVEIDPSFADAASTLWHDYQINLINDDFTALEANGKYNLIICNPPYVRHHFIDSDTKTRIINKTFAVSRVEISGLAGLYCHFLLQSIQWMAEGGVAGWLIPSEFMDVNYGKAIKEFLLSEVELFRIHRFNPEDAQFTDALVSSAMVWFRKKKPVTNDITFSYGGSLLRPQECKDISINYLKKEAKWTKLPCQTPIVAEEGTPKLKDFFTSSVA